MTDEYGYNYFYRTLEERLGEISYDISRTKNLLEDYEQEFKETKEAMRELKESRDKFIGLSDEQEKTQ